MPGHDWIEGLAAGGGEMGARVAAHGWARTPLGPPAGWSHGLRSTVRTILSSRYPMILTWGGSFTQIYNDAYAELIGDKHPAALGIDIRVTLASAWDTLGPMIERVMATRRANWTDALLLPLERSGYREEAYFSVSHAPAEDDDGHVAGMLAVCSEVTNRVVGSRRLDLLRTLVPRADEEPDEDAACERAVSVLAAHTADVPFACLYLHRGGVLSPSACVGVEPALRDTFVTRDVLARLARGEACELALPTCANGLAGGPFGDPVTRALAIPLSVAGGGTGGILGALVAGVNPARALDEEHRVFFDLLAGQAARSLAAAAAARESRARLEAMAALDRAKSEFFGNVSHEFRTPLTLMLSPLGAALQEGRALPPEEIIPVHRNALRLLKLVGSLLDVSRLEAGGVRVAFEPCDFARLNADLAGVFRSAVERAGLRLEVTCEPVGAPVSLDRDMWEKVVFNLLSNALKFTWEGTIGVSTAAEGGWAVLRVSDTGVGVPASELPRLFERFHRVRGARGRSIEGAGIGLALLREIVRLHGGEVAVSSEPGAGTVFEVRVPLGSAAAGDNDVPGSREARVESSEFAGGILREAETLAEAVKHAPDVPPGIVAHGARTDVGADVRMDVGADVRTDARTETGPGSVVGSSSRRAVVLVVDDNPDMRAYLTRLLSPRHEVVSAPDGGSALFAARARPPDLVLSDVMMPGLDGAGLLAALRADPSLAAIPVILLSARAGSEARVEGLALGADDYLVKPFHARELVAKVDSQLALAALRAQLREQSDALRVEREAARRALEAKDEFLTLVDHELRSPLAVVRGHIDLIAAELGFSRRGSRTTTSGGARDRTEATGTTAGTTAGRESDAGSARVDGRSLDAESLESLARSIDAVRRSLDREVALVDALVDLSHSSEGVLKLDPRPLALEPILEGIVGSFALGAEAKAVDLRFERVRAAGPVLGDETRLRRALFNLVENALKFSRPAGRVRVVLDGSASTVEVAVEDDGEGISPDFLPHVFEPLRQRDSSSTRAHGGLGIGLSVARRIVEAHGGSVRAESAGLGKGARFVVRLPLLSVGDQ